MRIEKLFIYPIKSLGGIEVDQIQLSRTGIQNDRMFMLTDAEGRFLTRREHKSLVAFGTMIQGNDLILFHRAFPDQKILLPLNPERGLPKMVDIWSDRCRAELVSAEADAFFSGHLGMKTHVVHMPETTKRRIDSRYTQGKEITSFTDGYQILLAGSASLDDLNSRLKANGFSEVGWERFRPNVVVRTENAFDEDEWRLFQMGSCSFKGVKLCSRCVMTTIDEFTGRASSEPLKTLAQYRSKGNKIYFGQNVISMQSSGSIEVGDTVLVSCNQ